MSGIADEIKYLVGLGSKLAEDYAARSDAKESAYHVRGILAAIAALETKLVKIKDYYHHEGDKGLSPLEIILKRVSQLDKAWPTKSKYYLAGAGLTPETYPVYKNDPEYKEIIATARKHKDGYEAAFILGTGNATLIQRNPEIRRIYDKFDALIDAVDDEETAPPLIKELLESGQGERYNRAALYAGYGITYDMINDPTHLALLKRIDEADTGDDVLHSFITGAILRETTDKTT